MNLTIPRTDLLQCVKLLYSVCPRTPSRPILNAMRIESTPSALLISGTDLEIGLEQQLAIPCIINHTIIVPVAPVMEFLRELTSDTIQWDLENDESLSLRSGKAKIKLKLTNSAEYPALPETPSTIIFSITPSDLHALLQETLPAVGENEARYLLNTIRLRLTNPTTPTLELVGTDSKRLVRTHRATGTWLSQDKETRTVLIPKKAARILSNVIDQTAATQVGIGLSPQFVGFQIGNLRLTSRIVEGNYPIIERAIPKSTTSFFTVPKTLLTPTLRRVSTINGREGNPIELTVCGRDLTLNSTNVGLGQGTETIELTEPGNNLTAGFNTDFLLDAVDSMPGQHCRFQMESPLSPCLLTTPERPEWQHVIMPIQINPNNA